MDAAPKTRLLLAVIGAVACGAGIAVQSRINGELGAELQDGYVGAVISFGSGLIILTVLMLFIRSGRTGVQRTLTAITAKEIPWFYAVGGAAGGFFVLTQGLASAALGVALFSIGVVCGQTVSGVVIDRIGLGHVEPRLLTKQRLIGAALALATVAALVVPKGLGYPIFLALREAFNTEIIAAGALAVALALVADALLVLAERALTPWSSVRRTT